MAWRPRLRAAAAALPWATPKAERSRRFFVAVIAAWKTLSGGGPFFLSVEGLYQLQQFTFLLSFSGLLFAAVLTERGDSEQQAHQSARQLITAQQIARMGSWHWDIARNVVTWSPELYHIYGIKPGEVGLITGKAGPTRLSTGVMVLYADDRSFTYMTPEGHPFAGWITFSAHDESDHAVAQVQALIRSNDPLYEAGFMVYGNRAEDRMWLHTLRELARHLGSPHEPTSDRVKVDRKRVWRNFKNITRNAMLTGMFRRKQRKADG